MPEQPLSADEIEAAFRANGLSMAEACRRATVAQSIFQRWKSGISGMSLASYARLIKALNVIQTEKGP